MFTDVREMPKNQVYNLFRTEKIENVGECNPVKKKNHLPPMH